MVENHIHDYFHPFGMCLVYKVPEFFIIPKAAVCLIIISDGITVVRAFLHVILLNRIQPYARHT